MEICRHGCLDHCQLSDSADRIQERKDVNVRPLYSQTTTTATSASHEEDGLMYDDIIQNNNNNDAMTSVGGQFLGVEKSAPKAQAQMMSNRVSMSDGSETNSGTTSMDPQHLPPILVIIYFFLRYQKEKKLFPFLLELKIKIIFS